MNTISNKAAWDKVAEVDAKLSLCKDEVPLQKAYEQFGTVPETSPLPVDCVKISH